MRRAIARAKAVEIGAPEMAGLSAAAAATLAILAPGLALAVLGGLAGLAGLMWLALHRDYAPEALMVASYVGMLGLKISVGSLNLRPNMLVALVAVLWMARSDKPVPYLRWFMAANVFYLLSTLIHPQSPYFTRGLADCFLLAVNLIQYVITFQAGNVQRLLKVMFVSSSICYSIMIVLYFAGIAGLLGGVFDQEQTDVVRLLILGTTQASYVLFTLLALLAYLYMFGFPFGRPATIWFLVSNLGALALSFARASWIAGAIVFGLFWLYCFLRFPLGRSLRQTSYFLLLLLLVAPAAFWYIGKSVKEALIERSQMVSMEEGTVLDRIELWTNMLEDWQKSPVFGHGAHDYAKYRDYPDQISENYVLELLHSGGLVTCGLFLTGLSLLIFKALPSTWAEAVGQPWSLPLVTGLVGMSLSAMTDPAMTGGTFWIGAGLVGAVGVMNCPS
jgi:hypothetical protein